jgi:hypothetical protein
MTAKERGRKHYLAHRAEVIAKAAAIRRANPERYREYKRAAYRRDPEKVKARSKRWHAAHPGYAAVQGRAWRERKKQEAAS